MAVQGRRWPDENHRGDRVRGTSSGRPNPLQANASIRSDGRGREDMAKTLKPVPPMWLSLVERGVACVFLLAVLPTFLLVALFIRQIGGRPIIVMNELPGGDGAAVRRYLRFRTTGSEASFFCTFGKFLRARSIDKLPGLWSVARGDIRLEDYFKLK